MNPEQWRTRARQWCQNGLALARGLPGRVRTGLAAWTPPWTAPPWWPRERPRWWPQAWPTWLPRRLPGGARTWVTLASFGFVLAALLQHGRALLELRLDPQGWLWLVLGVGVCVLSLVVNGLAWGLQLRWLGLHPRFEPLVVLYVTTNLRKYLPGGIWHLASRVQALRQGRASLPQPTGTGMALVAVLLEPLLAAVAALALVLPGGWQNGLALVCLLPMALLQPRWLNPLLQRLERRRAKDLGLERDLETEGPLTLPGYPWLPLLGLLVFVLLRYLGFACCLGAFDLQSSLDWRTALAGFALAWTVGLVVPGAPGGLGVFEAMLLLRLGGELPEASLLALAISYRLMVTVADLLAAGLVSLDERLVRLWPAAPLPAEPLPAAQPPAAREAAD